MLARCFGGRVPPLLSLSLFFQKPFRLCSFPFFSSPSFSHRSCFLTFALYTFLPRTFCHLISTLRSEKPDYLVPPVVFYTCTHIHSFSFLLLRGFLRSFSGYLSFLCSGSPFYHLAEQQLVAQRGLSKGIKDLPIVLRELRRTPSLVSKQTRSNNSSTKIDVFSNRWENTCTF